MSYLKEMLEYNEKFVENKEYEKFITTKYPDKKIAVLSCMDTRLTQLLPQALNFKNGDVKIIKNAGAVISHPFGSVMRSLIVSIYDLGVDDILVIGHDDCGMENVNSSDMIKKMISRGITQENLDFIKYCNVDLNNWLKGFSSPKNSVKETVEIIKNHPLIPKDINVYGFIMNSLTGKINQVN